MPLRWPSDLPQTVLALGYGRSYEDAVKATDMDKGPPRTRLRTSAAPQMAQCALVLDVDRLARFRRFFRDETQFGSIPFLIRDQILDGLPIQTAVGAPLLTAGGQPLTIAARWLAMFMPGQPPQEGDAQGRKLRISFSLLILP